MSETKVADVSTTVDAVSVEKGEVQEGLPSTALLLHKMDRVIMPIVSLLYLLAFLDRSNIGNAATAGMTEDLGLHGNQLNAAVSVFYVLYVLVETPATILVKQVGTSRMLTFVMISWSLVVIFSGFMKNYAGLLVTRLLLGLFEGCLFPPITLYLATVYTRNELQTRMAFFFGAAALSGAFGGLLAFGILQMDGIGGRKGWQWLYIIEGIVSLVGAALAFFLLPDDINTAWFLNEKDRRLVAIRTESGRIYHGQQQFSWQEVRRAFRDPKLWISSVGQFCSDIILYGFSTFLPAIVKTLGYTSLAVQYMTIPVYIVGAVVFVIVAVVADLSGKRVAILVPSGLIVAIGYSLQLATNLSNHVHYFSTFLVAMGVYTCVGVNLGWLNNNNAPHYKRATALGVQQTIGNTAGIVAGQIYIANQAPSYKLGTIFSLCAILVGVCSYIAMFLYLRWRNGQKLARQAAGLSDLTLDGDDSDEFMYIY